LFQKGEAMGMPADVTPARLRDGYGGAGVNLEFSFA
jgi:hypothetical protein